MKSIQILYTNKWRFHTDLNTLFNCIKPEIRKRNWILSNWETNFQNSIFDIQNDPVALTGKKLLQGIDKYSQLIWGVLSGSLKEFTNKDYMSFAMNEKSLWEPFYRIQNPEADLEIVSWDSGYTLVTSNDEDILLAIERRLGKNTVQFTDCIKTTKEYIGGMTVNERLSFMGLDEEFYKYIEEKEENSARTVLRHVGLSENDINSIIEKSLDPVKYFV